MNTSISSFQNLRLKLKRRLIQYLKEGWKNPSWFVMYLTNRIEVLRFLGIWLSKRPYDVKAYRKTSIFLDLDVDLTVEGLKRDGLASGFFLPQTSLQEILEFANSTQYWGNGNPKFSFAINDREEAELNYGNTLFTAHYVNPSEQCLAIKKIEQDSKLWEIAALYLETDPILIGSRLWWNFATDRTIDEALSKPFRFHYDLEDYRFIKFMFYLVDVDLENGPHVCVKGSHIHKKLRHQFSLIAEIEQEKVVQYYDDEDIKTICGKAGLGFVEDFHCFHKATVPKSKNRLILEIKFAMNQFNIDTSMLCCLNSVAKAQS
jgi:hypothetical protein